MILTINTNYFHEEYYLLGVYNWNIVFSVRWELNFMSYVMLPAVLPVDKYMWLMFYLYSSIFILFIFQFFYYDRVPVKNGWRNTSGTRTTILETVF
jgi:hypothetical protein